MDWLKLGGTEWGGKETALSLGGMLVGRREARRQKAGGKKGSRRLQRKDVCIIDMEWDKSV